MTTVMPPNIQTYEESNISRKRGSEKNTCVEGGNDRGVTRSSVPSLLVMNTTINLIFVCSIAWAVFGVLGRAIGAVGALIMEGDA